MSQLTRKYDHVIIGSGISGLLCGAYLSKKGLNVIVLEKNHQIGGCLQVFSRDKKIFDTGVHYIGGLGPGQTLKRLFDFIGIGEMLKFEQLDINGFDRIIFDDEGIEYCLGQGWDRFVSVLSDHFPEEHQNLLDLVKTIKNLVSLFGPYHLEPLKKGSISLEILSVSAYDKLNSMIRSSKLVAILGGNSILYAGDKYTTPFYMYALIINSYVEGAYRLIHGGSQISKYLSMVIHQHGGIVQKYANVTSIKLKDGMASSVMINESIEIKTDNIIAAIHPAVVLNLLPDDVLRSSFKDRIRSLQNTTSFISVYFALHKNVLPYFNHNLYVLKDMESAWNLNNSYDDSWPANIMISTGCEEHGQAFANTLNVLAYCDHTIFEPWKDTFNTTAVQNDRGQTYEAFKNELIEIITKKVENQISGFRDMYFSVYCSTPLTYRDFLNVPDGTGYGIVKSYKDALYTYVSPKMKIPNLYLTGQNTDLHGVYGSAISALLTLEQMPIGVSIFDEINNVTSES